jgi:Heterokaryon incompatibility protein (HET)
MAERSQQVQFMAKIYERAQLIHVWLGRDENHTAEMAFRLLRRLRGSFDDPSFLSEFTQVQNMNVEQFENEEFHALKELYDLPWVNLEFD